MKHFLIVFCVIVLSGCAQLGETKHTVSEFRVWQEMACRISLVAWVNTDPLTGQALDLMFLRCKGSNI